MKAHHVSRAALVATGIAAALAFFAIGAGVRLLFGPVSLGPFGNTLAEALDRALPGIEVKYDQAAIEWERDEGRVNLVILGTRVFDSSGRIIAQAPKAEIGLAARPFLQGNIVVKRIALVGVQLTLVRTANGGLRLGVEKDKQEHDILSRISDAIRTTNGRASSLESFAVRNARLAFYDETTGLFVVAPQADFRLATAGNNLDARVNADVEISGHPAHVAADIRFPPKTGEVGGDVAITGLEVRALAANSKTFAAVKDTALKVDISGSFKVARSHLLSADFGASAAGAFVIPGVRDGGVRVRRMNAVGRYDGVNQRLLIDDATIESDRINGHIQGKVDLQTLPTGELAKARGELRLDSVALNLPGVFAEPVQFQLVDFRGAWLPSARQLVIEHLGVNGKPLALQASGDLTMVKDKSPAISISASLSPMSVRDVVRYWPVMAAPGARDWAAENMQTGVIGPVSLEMHVPAGMLDAPTLPAEALTVKFTLAGGEINYIKGLTHLTQVQGAAVVDGNSFKADISSAKIGPLVVSGAKFAIPDLGAADETGDITGQVQGSMSDVLALVDMPPLRYPTRFNVNAADSKGTAKIDLSFRVPMRKALDVDQVAIGIKAAVTGFSLALGPHTRLTDGTINFAIDNTKLRATGTSGLGGSAARVALDWTEDFKTANAVTTKISVKGTVDDQARTALGLKTKDYIRGPIGISGTLTGHRGALTQGALSLDLTPSALTVDFIGVNKPAGFPMTAKVDLGFGPKSAIASEGIRITGPGTSVTASAKYDGTGKLSQLHAPSVKVGPIDDFALDLNRGSSGLDVQLRGKSLDGSRLAHHGSGSDDDTLDEPFHINAKLDRLVLRDGVALSQFALDVAGIADKPSSMTLSATLSKTATVSASIAPNGNGRHMSLATNDMGTLTRGLFGFNSMRGGKFDFSASFPGRADQPTSDANTPDFEGKMTLRDFRVVDQPFLARVFTAGSLGGMVNLMRGQGIEVDTLDVQFSSRNGVVAVRDARATGPAIGITADGYVDRSKNDIALKGTIVPIYGINSVLGNIPLIGDVLTSKQGEGIFGMSYSVTGNADEPSVSINPLSVLAPGILRRIFEGRMPTPPSNTPKPAAPTPPQPQPNTQAVTPSPKGQ
ncbi:MAG: AsmA-like C-terminal domain-containing protein [Alphaproteobacteria bacterium]|nr:AsmA-like C-terminal domain-containing protein [Alphaproteobacteria bacterium]